ncbi:MAG: class IV adenylate cyclase [Chloroflexi bacterium]|nr:class IV adenylate cyclase [Chloroflexota bacterium]MXX81967.1 class IV adenylate cyclase [Chloroflexota bacterium]MYC54497.1 class IV adenylate cyclase [Chloroflexota bacterium]MYE78431.1 class IV adenylate cyclase [Chloroflexota bacterium]
MKEHGKMREVEVKLHSPDLALVQRALHDAGAKLVKERVFERNLRYDSADGSLIAGGEVLRLRQDTAVKLTYKSDATLENGIVSRLEAEVTVSDFASMDAILRRLGFHVALVYEKYRETYALLGAEVVLDELPFGNFTEIEGDAPTIERVVAALSLGNCRRIESSYVDLFMDVKARLGMSARDCTFAAFVDVDVGELFLPPSTPSFMRAQSGLAKASPCNSLIRPSKS